ncbi:MAG: class II aldolase/adducin family protein [Tissierellia bacterium]|nr:class II aldolase/adducin family protein [Tissierellia bacterium]
MDIEIAKDQVVKAGKMLIERGLIARTWGNISCRVSDKQFVITPSGKAYDTLRLNDIVLVNIEDLSYPGDVKPSSEKGIHAEAYKHRPDINFVIHTHQVNASIVSTLDLGALPLNEKYSIIGSDIPIAKYALPGTKKLRKNISHELTSTNSKAIIMAKHGALCLGEDLKEAFMVASELEKACEDFLLNYCNRLYRKSYRILSELNDLYLEKNSRNMSLATEVNAYDSERIGNTIYLYSKGQVTSKIDLVSGELVSGEGVPEGELHRLIYNSRQDIRSIAHTKQEDILTVSKVGKTVYPLLDDFAQIIGPSMSTAKTDGDIVKALKKNNGVFLKDNGAFCCGPSREDAYAAELVTIKCCKAWVAASLFGKVKPINKLESVLMRFIYKNKYSKEMGNHEET